MIYNEWEKIYKKINKEINLNFNDDEQASIFLDNYLENKENNYDITKIENSIKESDVIIFGAGTSLKSSLHNNLNFLKKKLIISADGATSALLEYNITPDIIITDLDGKISDQVNANSNNSIAIIHSHGDNIITLEDNIEKFEGEILGTTQLNPKNFKNLYNFGGFTDGDRAVLMASHFGAKNIFLIGFDFNNKIGEYSNIKNKDINKKLLKLEWCKKIINQEAKRKNIIFIR